MEQKESLEKAENDLRGIIVRPHKQGAHPVSVR